MSSRTTMSVNSHSAVTTAEEHPSLAILLAVGR